MAYRRCRFVLGFGLAVLLLGTMIGPRTFGAGQNAQQQAQQQAQQRAQQQAQQAQQQLQRLIQQQQRMTQQQWANMMRQAQQAQRNQKNQPQPVMKAVDTDFEIVVADAGTIRTMIAPMAEEGEDGKPKKLSAEERLKLKGDTAAERKLPGYKASADDLQAGDTVTVTISRYRPAKVSKTAKTEDEDETTKDKKKPAAKKDADDEDEKPKEKKKPAAKKDADDEDEKPKDKKKPAAKKDEEEKDGEEMKDEKKSLVDWKPYGKLQGVIASADSGRITLRITNYQWVMQQPNQKNNQNQNAAPNNIALDGAMFQATLVVIQKRGEAPMGGGGAAPGGFGGNFKESK